MAAWSSGSAVFNAFVRDTLSGTALAPKLATDSFKVALFNNNVIPDNTAVSSLTAYNAATSQWVAAGNEVTDATNWVAGGRALGSPAISTTGLNYTMLSAANTTGGGNVTLASVYGDLLYDITSTLVANQGIAFHSYGGSAQGVAAGTFTVIWNALGCARWTHTQA